MSEQTPALTGEIRRIVYSNPDNHWSVLRLEQDDGRGSATIVGNLAGVNEGERLKVWGRWINDPRYGQQLRVNRYEIVLPVSVEAIERYLSSGMIAGVGPKTARLLVKRFGTRTLQVIDRNPERLKTVKGIGKKRLATLIKSWRENSGVREVMVFLQGLGISPTLAVKIFKEYGHESVGRVRANPYDLARDVWGVGFHKSDRIAKELGIVDDHPERIRAGLVHVLQEGRSDGHLCLPREALVEAGAALLGVPVELLGTEVSELEQTGRIILERNEDLVYVPELHRAEVDSAAHLLRLLDADVLRLDEQHLKLVLAQAEGTLGLELASAQREAVRTALTSRVSVVTGGPGTGKTTIVKVIVSALTTLNEKVALCAPTGRASMRMTMATGREAKTIHRLLEWQPQEAAFARDEYNPIDVDAVVVDEVSMVDVPLFERLVKAIPEGGRLILVGDVDQLPSVGPGAVLRDLIRSEVVPVVRLEDIYRQAKGSLITVNAHRILNGQMPKAPPDGEEQADFYWVERDDPEGIKAIIRKVILERISAAFGLDPRRDVQVLTPMHRGPLGSEELNTMLGSMLNPHRAATKFSPGDKVMQVRNNYEKEVYNGDVGFVDRIAEDNRTLLVRFTEPHVRIVSYDSAEQEQLVTAWAISIHKSQGSEYPAVVVPLHSQHFMMLRRNLIYTAMTRGKQLVVLVGSRKALGIAVRESRAENRFGRLAERLQELAR